MTAKPYHRSMFLSWAWDDGDTLKGFLSDDPETTLFLFSSRGDGRGDLTGAFFRDEEEPLENISEYTAFAFAEASLREWCAEKAAKILNGLRDGAEQAGSQASDDSQASPHNEITLPHGTENL